MYFIPLKYSCYRLSLYETVKWLIGMCKATVWFLSFKLKLVGLRLVDEVINWSLLVSGLVDTEGQSSQE